MIRDPINAELFVVTSIFNPQRYQSRWALYEKFAEHVRRSGAQLVTIEAAFGERAHAIEPKDPHHFQVRLDDKQEIWLKENLLNLAVQRLPPEARYIAFVDADVQFSRTDWAEATIHALQHYPVVQMFRTAIDLSPQHEPLLFQQGFCFNYLHGLPKPPPGTYTWEQKGVQVYHPGFAWAWRRSALDQCGGLLDRAICGAGDHHMAWALVGQAGRSIHGGVTQPYKDMVMRWQGAASPLHGNVGFVDGTLLHHWHGRKASRGYISRWQILVDNKYDPDRDVRPDSQGVLALTGTKPKLIHEIRAYLGSRAEDCVYVPESNHQIVNKATGQKGAVK